MIIMVNVTKKNVEDLIEKAVGTANLMSSRYLTASWSGESVGMDHPEMQKAIKSMANKFKETIDERIIHELLHDDYFKVIRTVMENVIKQVDPDGTKLGFKRTGSFKLWHETYELTTQSCDGTTCPIKTASLEYDGDKLRIDLPYCRNAGLVQLSESLDNPSVVPTMAEGIKIWVDYASSDEHTSRHAHDICE